jgi:DNA-binding CsgD family transcriptional regulator
MQGHFSWFDGKNDSPRKRGGRFCFRPGRNPKRIGEDKEKQIATSYASGKSAREIAEELGLKDATVLSVLHRNGIEIRDRKRFGPRKVLEMISLYQEGRSSTEIADKFKTNSKTILNYLRKEGVEIRPTMAIAKGLVTGHEAAAVRAVQWAMKAGKLAYRACELCGVGPYDPKTGRLLVQWHHDDYTKALDVRSLCTKCHNHWHLHNEPVRVAEKRDCCPRCGWREGDEL